MKESERERGVEPEHAEEHARCRHRVGDEEEQHDTELRPAERLVHRRQLGSEQRPRLPRHQHRRAGADAEDDHRLAAVRLEPRIDALRERRRTQPLVGEGESAYHHGAEPSRAQGTIGARHLTQRAWSVGVRELTEPLHVGVRERRDEQHSDHAEGGAGAAPERNRASRVSISTGLTVCNVTCNIVVPAESPRRAPPGDYQERRRELHHAQEKRHSSDAPSFDDDETARGRATRAHQDRTCSRGASVGMSREARGTR